jgi:FkbM family methyltransferase
MWKDVGRVVLRSYVRTFPVKRGKYRLIETIGRHFAPPDLLETALPDGSVMLVDIAEHIQRNIYFFGSYESTNVELFRKLAKPGMTVIDVGANVGQYTILAAAAVGPGGAVHAFEPDAKNAERLRANLAANNFSDIHLNVAALSDEPGELTLFSANNDNAGEHSLFQFDPNMQGHVIPAMTLDGYVQTAHLGASGSVDLIKIDVQGAEAKVLLGGVETLKTHKPLIVCEFEERWLQGMGSSCAALKTWLQELGYVAYRFEPSRRLKPTATSEIHFFANLLLVHDSKRPSLSKDFRFC